jgi:hypothetical protein
MGEHLCKNGFKPGYHRWVFHGESKPKCAREEEEEESTQSQHTGEFDTGIDDC